MKDYANTRRNVAIALHHALSSSDYHVVAGRLVDMSINDPDNLPLLALVEDLARLGSYTAERTI